MGLNIYERDSSEDDGMRTTIIAVLAIFITLTVVTTALRNYSRAWILKKYGFEDGLMCFANVGLIIICGSGIGALAQGLISEYGHTSQPLKLGVIINTVVITYTPTIALTKLSILLQMLHIFVPIHGTKTYYSMLVFIVCNMLYYVADFVIIFVSCFPRSKTMRQEIPGTCVADFRNVISTSICNTVSDVAMLVLPMVWISRLHMGLGKKILAGSIFTVGILACVASVVRLVFSMQMLNKNEGNLDEKVRLALCMAAEITAGIVAGNLPSLPALIKSLSRKRKDNSEQILKTQRGESDQYFNHYKASKETPSFV